MKKLLFAIILVSAAALLCSCNSIKGGGENTQSKSEEAASNAEEYIPEDDAGTHYKYSHYAIEGCVIVESDESTGQCVYKTVCPVCGEANPGTHSGYLKSGTFSSGSTCTNSDCTSYGDSFSVKIESHAQMIDG